MADEELQQTNSNNNESQDLTSFNKIDDFIKNPDKYDLEDENIFNELKEAVNNYDNSDGDIDNDEFKKIKLSFQVESDKENKQVLENVEKVIPIIAGNGQSQTLDSTDFKTQNQEKEIEQSQTNDFKFDLSKIDLNKSKKLKDVIDLDIAEINLNIEKKKKEEEIQINQINQFKKELDDFKKDLYNKTNIIIEETNKAIENNDFNKKIQSNVLLTRVYGKELTTNLNHIKEVKTFLDAFNKTQTRENAVNLRNAFFEKRDIDGKVVDPNNPKAPAYLDGSSYIKNVDEIDSKFSALVQGNKFNQNTPEWEEKQKELDEIRNEVTNIFEDRLTSITMKEKTVNFANQNIEANLKAKGVDTFSNFEIDIWSFDKQKNEWSKNKVNILDDIIDLDKETISKKLDSINKQNMEYYQSRPGAIVNSIYNALHSRNEVEAMKSKYGVFEYISMYKAGGMALELAVLNLGLLKSVYDLIKSSNQKSKILNDVMELKKTLNTEDYLNKKNELIAVDMSKEIKDAYEEAKKSNENLSLEDFLKDKNSKEILEKYGVTDSEFTIIYNAIGKYDKDEVNKFNEILKNNDINENDFKLYDKYKNDLNKLKLIDEKIYNKFTNAKDKLESINPLLSIDNLNDFYQSKNITTKMNSVKTLDVILKEVNEIENKNVEDLNKDLDNLNNNFKELLEGVAIGTDQYKFLNIHIQNYKDQLIEFKKQVDDYKDNGFDKELEAIDLCEQHNILIAKGLIYQTEGKELDSDDKRTLKELEDKIRIDKGLKKNVPIESLYDIKKELARKEEIENVKNKYESLSNKIDSNIKSMEEIDKKLSDNDLDENEKKDKFVIYENNTISTEINKDKSVFQQALITLLNKPEYKDLLEKINKLQEMDQTIDLETLKEIDDENKKEFIGKFLNLVDKFKIKVKDDIISNVDNKNVSENTINNIVKEKLQDALCFTKVSQKQETLHNVLLKTLFQANKLDDLLFELKPENLDISKENSKEVLDLKILRYSIQKGLNSNNDKEIIKMKDVLNIDFGKDSKITEYNKALRDLVNSNNFESIKNLLPKDIQNDCIVIQKNEKTLELIKIEDIKIIDKNNKVEHSKLEHMKSDKVNQKIIEEQKDIIEKREKERKEKDRKIQEQIQLSRQNKQPEQPEQKTVDNSNDMSRV